MGTQFCLSAGVLDHKTSCVWVEGDKNITHLNRDKIESNLNVPGIQGRHENALIKSFEMSLDDGGFAMVPLDPMYCTLKQD